jgi:hypothetical protein
VTVVATRVSLSLSLSLSVVFLIDSHEYESLTYSFNSKNVNLKAPSGLGFNAILSNKTKNHKFNTLIHYIEGMTKNKEGKRIFLFLNKI